MSKFIENRKINNKHYENISLNKSNNAETILDALKIIKKFIIREKKILVGGMSIDMALKLKDPNSGIYDDNTIPDYDFYSDKHYEDAYDIAQWLNRLNFKNISVINAMHPSTMKVRINFITIADITYIPTNILENIPTLRYKGFKIVHPHYQMIDQHRSLSYPYENSPWETIIFRSKKDMTRYDLLYDFYPLRMLNISKKKIIISKKTNIDIKLIDNTCITGFCALNYWVSLAKTKGFKALDNLGVFTFNKNKLEYSLPVDSHGLTIYCDDIKKIYNNIKNNNNIEEERFYEKFLDKLPRKVIINNKFELLENEHMVAAHKLDDKNIYIANLQTIMLYFSVNYILLRKIKNIDRGYSFYKGYLLCRDLLIWASNNYYLTKTNRDKEFKLFFPTEDTYGSNNISESYKVSKINFDYKNNSKTITDELKNLYKQPMHVYDRDLKFRKVPKIYYNFNYTNSLVFNLHGKQIDNFI